jgi:hypothetical protein
MIPDDKIGLRRICADCVGESYLHKQIKQQGIEAECCYCEETGVTISMDELADFVELAFDQHYRRTAQEPEGLEWTAISEGGYEWERKGDTVEVIIADEAKVDEGIAEEIRELLEDRHYDHELAKMQEEGAFDSEACYIRKRPEPDEYQALWNEFERGLKFEARYLSRSAHSTLDIIFKNLDDYRTHDNSPVVVEAGPGKQLQEIYRARVFQSQDKLKDALMRPDLEIGPPPWKLASAGRMNARGISIFYGANTSETALREVRPPVGSEVVTAKFHFVRPIRLLDVSALRFVTITGSVFDAAYRQELERASFLELLSHLIVRPVLPDDEPFEYLATQAIADYLSTEQKLDGIIYSSSQIDNGSSNVALFYPAAKVELIPIAKGSKLDACLGMVTEEGYESYFFVTETLSDSNVITESAPSELIPSVDYERLLEADVRPVTLRLDTKHLTVSKIHSVSYRVENFSVSRHAIKPSKGTF